MKYKNFLWGALSMLMSSCSNELELPVNLTADSRTTPLTVSVMTNPTTKALVSGTELPVNSKIGVKLVKSDGSLYDNKTYNNIFYNTTDGVHWNVDPNNKILLSATEGKAFAYFPYVESSSLDFKAIPISSAANQDDQTDYMFGSVASGLNNSNKTASFTMSHAMSIVEYEIVKGSYTGTGSITAVKMCGNTASNTGTMNAEAGSVTATNAGYEFTSTNSLSLGSSTGKFIVVPSGTASKLDFKVTMDEQTYTASTAELTLQSGQVYKYTLSMNSTGLTVSQVSVIPWSDAQDMGRLDTELYDPWTAAKSVDGVYAIKADGSPVNYAFANEGSYAGVAFVVNGKAYQIAKVDAVQTENAEDISLVYWQKENSSDISGLTNYTTVDDTNEGGYLPGGNGNFPQDCPDSYKLNGDWTVWPNYVSTAALSDFNGAYNTATIIEAQTVDGNLLDYTIGKAVVAFRNNASYNEGKSDWFVPSAGELSFMFRKVSEINSLITKVTGASKIIVDDSGYYWTSSEFQSIYARIIGFSNGLIDALPKQYSNKVRMIREM